MGKAEVTDRAIEQALEVKAGEAEERGDEGTPAADPRPRLEPVEHQPSLLWAGPSRRGA